jgi:hypothetical protein
MEGEKMCVEGFPKFSTGRRGAGVSRVLRSPRPSPHTPIRPFWHPEALQRIGCGMRGPVGGERVFVGSIYAG